MLARCFALPMMRSNLPFERSCNCSAIGASGAIAAAAAVVAPGSLGAIVGAAVVADAGGLSDAAAGLSDCEPAAAGSLGTVVRVPGFSSDAGVAAPVGEDSELDVGVAAG